MDGDIIKVECTDPNKMIKCINDSNCFHLTNDDFYEVVKMNHYLVWVIDDRGDTCQYLKERFDIN